MSLIPKETLLMHLQRAEMASDVKLPIEFFRDLVYQAMPRTWVGLTDDELLKTYGWEFVSYGQSDRPSLGPSILDEAKQEIIDGLRKVEAALRSKNT